MDLNSLSTKQKFLLFGGGLVVLLFLWKAVSGHNAGSGSSVNSAVNQTGQLQDMMNQFAQANAQQSQAMVQGMQQSESDIIAAIAQGNQATAQAITQGNQSITQALSQSQQSTTQALTQTLAANQQSQSQLLSGLTSLFQFYQQNQTATPVTSTPAPSHPSSAPLGSYDQTVNAKGGQYLDGKWAAGHYVDGNTFVADNQASANIYNNFEKSRGWGGVAIVK